MRYTFKATAAAAAAAALGAGVAFGAAGSASAASATAGLTPPQAGAKVASSVGKGEGHLNLIAWEGYAQPEWVKPFEKQTGCQVSTKYAGTSSEMVSLMANGGGGQYDLVSASGDADLRVIYAGDVRPININLIPSWTQFHPFLKAPAFNTIGGKHYGVSYEFGPNVLLYSTKVFHKAPTSWSVLYSKKFAGRITVPDNPIQIADAALYLSKTRPSLGITDPYELTTPQFTAAVSLLKSEHPLIKRYWALASQEISLFQSKTTVVGAAWPYQTNTLRAAKVAVADTIPNARARPAGRCGCSRRTRRIRTARTSGCSGRPPRFRPRRPSTSARPANKLARPIMDKLQEGCVCGLPRQRPRVVLQDHQVLEDPARAAW